jgi:hypothetical protein
MALKYTTKTLISFDIYLFISNIFLNTLLSVIKAVWHFTDPYFELGSVYKLLQA